MYVLVTQSCLTLCDPIDYSTWGSSVRGIPQARLLEWVAIPFSTGSFWPRDQTRVSCIAGRLFTVWTTREASSLLSEPPGKPQACQAPLSVEFSRQESCSGLPFPSPGDLSDPGIKPGSPILQTDTLTSEPPPNIFTLRVRISIYGLCCCSVAKSCATLCDPMDCSMPGFFVLHYLLESAQIHVHWVSDAI